MGHTARRRPVTRHLRLPVITRPRLLGRRHSKVEVGSIFFEKKKQKTFGLMGRAGHGPSINWERFWDLWRVVVAHPRLRGSGSPRRQVRWSASPILARRRRGGTCRASMTSKTSPPAGQQTSQRSILTSARHEAEPILATLVAVPGDICA